MANEIPAEYRQRFIGLLTNEQKQAGYFVSQDEDFIYVFHGINNIPNCVAVFFYEVATVKEIRETTEEYKKRYENGNKEQS